MAVNGDDLSGTRAQSGRDGQAQSPAGAASASLPASTFDPSTMTADPGSDPAEVGHDGRHGENHEDGKPHITQRSSWRPGAVEHHRG